MDIASITIAGVGAVPFVLALVELIKRNAPYAKQYSAFISIGVGVVIVNLAQGFGMEATIAGIVVGLSASGLWSGSKSMKK